MKSALSIMMHMMIGKRMQPRGGSGWVPGQKTRHPSEFEWGYHFQSDRGIALIVIGS